MQGIEKNMEKQLIVRAFEPDMEKLKQTVMQLGRMQDVSLNLYGNAGEVLMVITARAHAQAAATELTENVAEQLELALGDAAYGRGKGSLAYFTAGAMIERDAMIAAADAATGALLSEEFSHTKRGPAVFDFGEDSYNDSRFAQKVRKAVERNADEEYAPQVAAARAVAAAKTAHAEYGAASFGIGSEEENIYIAVACSGYVYMKEIPNKPGADKKAALSILDIVRRLALKQPMNGARVFRANDDFSWDAPILKKAPGKSAAGPVIVLAVLLVALAVACWYFFTHFSFGGSDTDDALQVSSDTSISEQQPEVSSAPEQPVQPEASSEQAPAPESESKNTGIVNPFA